MKVIIRKNYDECAEYVAKHIEEKITKTKPTKENPFILGLPTGSTPLGVYQRLIEKVKVKALSFKDVVTFNMDEYVGLSKDDPQSYRYFMYNNFFDYIDIDRNNIHILNGMAKELEKECKEYEEKIAQYKKIDLFFGGIGSDGHIAFNEPGSSLASRTRVKNLAIETIEANSRFFEGDCSRVPKQALTVGIGTIMDSEEVLIMATGHAKARAIKHAIEGSVNHLWTVSALQLHKNAILVCDDEAMEEVKVKTYRYFKETENSL
ncbi:MAG: glucosamine-6-phosphate deaminase [Treponema sp.]